MRWILAGAAVTVGLLPFQKAIADEWQWAGRIHPFMLLEHLPDYEGKFVSLLCYVTQAAGDYAVCPMFNNFAEPTYIDVLLILQEVPEKDRTRALERCAGGNLDRLCRAAVGGTIFKVPTTGTPAMKVLSIGWSERDPA